MECNLIHENLSENLSSDKCVFSGSPNPEPVVFVNRSTDAEVSPELLIVYNRIYQKFGGNIARISEYYAIFVRSMNNRYTTSVIPRVPVKITGIVIMDAVLQITLYCFFGYINFVLDSSKPTVYRGPCIP